MLLHLRGHVKALWDKATVTMVPRGGACHTTELGFKGPSATADSLDRSAACFKSSGPRTPPPYELLQNNVLV